MENIAKSNQSSTQSSSPLKIEVTQNSDILRVSLIPPSEANRPTKLSILFVVDGSLSMGETISGNTTVLDCVKKSIKDISDSLSISDKFSLIGFSTHSKIYINHKLMDDSGKQSSITEIDKMWAGGQTNILAGLYDALNIIAEQEDINKQAESRYLNSIFLITDGESTMIPSQGMLESLLREKDRLKIDFALNTFGLRDKTDSETLAELSLHNAGVYCYLEDPQKLTQALKKQIIFSRDGIYQITNAQMNVSIATITSTDQGENNHIKPSKSTTWKQMLHPCIIRKGNVRDYIFKLPNNLKNQQLTVQLKAQLSDLGDVSPTKNIDMQVLLKNQPPTVDDIYGMLRMELVDKLKLGMSRLEGGFYDIAVGIVNTLLGNIKSHKNDLDGLEQRLQCLEQYADIAQKIFSNAAKDFAKDGKHKIIEMISKLTQEQEE